MGYYTEAEKKEIRRLRAKRRADSDNRQLVKVEEAIHAAAYARYHAAHGHAPTPDIPSQELAGPEPLTKAPWAREPDPLPPLNETPGWRKVGPQIVEPTPGPLAAPPPRPAMRRKRKE